MISQRSIDHVLSSVPIESVIGDFVGLKKRGTRFLGLCPFHNERTPSFTVNPEKGFYKCFGCGASGNSIKFLIEHEHLAFHEAVRFLADKYHITLEFEGQVEKTNPDIFSVNSFALEYFRDRYREEGNEGAAYASSRLVPEEFLPGFAPAGGKTLVQAASDAGYSESLLMEAGLVTRNEKGATYQVFRNRLVFPFYDLSNRVIGFTGRSLVDDKKIPKYLNSPETRVFKKGSVLFGLNVAKRAIIDEDECYLVEGNIDVSSFYRQGIKNTVCSSGTALTREQLRLIKRFTSNITFIYDGDPAGLKAAFSAIPLALEVGFNVYLVQLEQGQDPDSLACRLTEKELKDYLEKNRTDWIRFLRVNAQEKVLKDAQKKQALLKNHVEFCAKIMDEADRSTAIHRLGVEFDHPEKNLLVMLKKHELPRLDQIKYEGFYAFAEAAEAIAAENKIHIIDDLTAVVEHHLDDKAYYVGLPLRLPFKTELHELLIRTRNVYLDVEFPKDLIRNNSFLIDLASQMYENGCLVLVRNEEDRFVDFLDYYIEACNDYIFFRDNDNYRKEVTERVAQMMSGLDNTMITLKLDRVSRNLLLSTTAFTKILKPYLDKRKNQSSLNCLDIVIDENKYVFDIDELPGYVDKKFFYKFGFFPAENNQGKKIFYVFRTQDGNLTKVGNFYLEPLFQIWHLDPNKNKRIVKLNHAELNKSEYVEMPSSGMMDFAVFKKFLWNQGGYVFSRGKAFHHEQILESIALQFPRAFEFETFGWQPENFFAFANGVFNDGTFTHVDELGLVKHKEQTYYSPAFSVIFKDQRSDSDKYKNDRFLVFKESSDTSFEQWAHLMNEVYKYNSNGMWALLFTIMAANRSFIYMIERYFTAPFFIGPTESGKSRIAESVCAPYTYGAPLFNLNSGTDAAFFTVLERYRDVPVSFEEYNDYQISDIKFQGLKAAVYDSEGKTKRKDASSKELDISAVNCAPILLGQEAPERDDGSLGNRCVMLHVPKRDNWAEDEINLYIELKEREKKGLTNILLEILKRRSLVKQHYTTIQRMIHKKLKEDLNSRGAFYQTRIVNTVSLFVSMARFWCDYAPELKLPFTFEEFYEVALKKIVTQSEQISQSNRVSVFFDTLVLLLNREHNNIIEGREYRIKLCTELQIQKSRSQMEDLRFSEPRKVIFLRMNILHPLYRDINKAESLKPNALMMYLRDHPAWLGQIKNMRFRWKEVREIPNPAGYPERQVHTAEQITSCVALDYEKLGVDLEKFKTEEDPESQVINAAKSIIQPVQQEIDFLQQNDEPPF